MAIHTTLLFNSPFFHELKLKLWLKLSSMGKARSARVLCRKIYEECGARFIQK